MPSPTLFRFAEPWCARRAGRVMARLPRLAGERIAVEPARELRDRRGAVHGGSFLRERRIVMACTATEFPRIFVHELFHFVWVRAGNRTRREFEELLAAERRAGARGELGWSAEWRKKKLTEDDVALRRRAWRLYCCESFCDTAAWRYSGMERHEEFTLAARFRARRGAWFRETIETGTCPI